MSSESEAGQRRAGHGLTRRGRDAHDDAEAQTNSLGGRSLGEDDARGARGDESMGCEPPRVGQRARLWCDAKARAAVRGEPLETPRTGREGVGGIVGADGLDEVRAGLVVP